MNLENLAGQDCGAPFAAEQLLELRDPRNCPWTPVIGGCIPGWSVVVQTTLKFPVSFLCGSLPLSWLSSLAKCWPVGKSRLGRGLDLTKGEPLIILLQT